MSDEKKEQKMKRISRENSCSSILPKKEEILTNKKSAEELKESAVKSRSNTTLFLEYFKAGGSYCTFILIILLFMLTQLTISIFEYWLSYWYVYRHRLFYVYFDFHD